MVRNSVMSVVAVTQFCQNSSNYDLKWVSFIVCKICFNPTNQLKFHLLVNFLKEVLLLSFAFKLLVISVSVKKNILMMEKYCLETPVVLLEALWDKK